MENQCTLGPRSEGASLPSGGRLLSKVMWLSEGGALSNEAHFPEGAPFSKGPLLKRGPFFEKANFWGPQNHWWWDVCPTSYIVKRPCDQSSQGLPTGPVFSRFTHSTSRLNVYQLDQSSRLSRYLGGKPYTFVLNLRHPHLLSYFFLQLHAI